jgi:DNA-binding response OmpR family regulator
LVTVEAENGSAGLHALEHQAHPPKCVLVVGDREIPVMDGPTMIGHLRDQWDPATLPVLLMSGTLGELDTADGFLEKPFPIWDLVALAERLTTRLELPLDRSIA